MCGPVCRGSYCNGLVCLHEHIGAVDNLVVMEFGLWGCVGLGV